MDYAYNAHKAQEFMEHAPAAALKPQAHNCHALIANLLPIHIPFSIQEDV